MESGLNTENFFQRYLLGWLEPDEQERLEKQLLTDDKYLEELEAAEDELIDNYVRGNLSERDRDRFTQHFLAASERQRKLSFAESLHRYVNVAAAAEVQPAVLHPSIVNAQRSSFWNRLTAVLRHAHKPLVVSLAAPIVVVIVGASWWTVKNLSPQYPSSPAPNSAMPAVTLLPSRDRETGIIKKLTIAKDISTVELQLELSRDEYQSYSAVVQNVEGSEIFSAGKLQPVSLTNRHVVTLSVPTRLLARGEFQIGLKGVGPNGEFEDVAKYYLRVVATGP